MFKLTNIVSTKGEQIPEVKLSDGSKFTCSFVGPGFSGSKDVIAHKLLLFLCNKMHKVQAASSSSISKSSSDEKIDNGTFQPEPIPMQSNESSLTTHQSDLDKAFAGCFQSSKLLQSNHFFMTLYEKGP